VFRLLESFVSEEKKKKIKLLKAVLISTVFKSYFVFFGIKSLSAF